MHEAALFRDLGRALARIGGDRPGERIVRATVRIGPLSHVAAATLRAEWPAITRGTGAEGAELVIETSDDLRDPAAAGLLLASIGVEPRDAPPANVQERPAGAE